MARRAGNGSAVLFGLLAVLALVAVAVVFFVAAPRDGTGSDPGASPSPSHNGGVPVGVPEQEAVPAEEIRPFVTSAVYSPDDSTVTVRAFIPGQSEENGTCRATLTGGGRSWTTTATAYVEVATTACPPLVIMVDSAFDTSWRVVVQYESSMLDIESEESEVVWE